jgi:hypothetical protein
MVTRITTAAACLSLFAAPAYANCSEELTKLEPAVISAETGASTDSGTTGATGQVEALSPHQKQVLGKGTAGEADVASQLMKDAKEMAEARDEDGCMQKLAELKQYLGAK